MPEDVTLESYARGLQLRKLADDLTDFRDEVAIPLGIGFAVIGQNWLLAGVGTAAGASDYFDGIFGKEADKLLGLSPSNEASEDDHKADKKLTYSLLGGLLIRDIADGHYGSAAFVGTIISALAVRDSAQAKLRAEASLEGKRIGAIEINRRKTVVIIGACVLGMTPLGKTNAGRLARNAGLALGTGMGIKGYFDFKKHLRTAQPA